MSLEMATAATAMLAEQERQKMIKGKVNRVLASGASEADILGEKREKGGLEKALEISPIVNIGGMLADYGHGVNQKQVAEDLAGIRAAMGGAGVRGGDDVDGPSGPASGGGIRKKLGLQL